MVDSASCIVEGDMWLIYVLIGFDASFEKIIQQFCIEGEGNRHPETDIKIIDLHYIITAFL
jgi:hypothetical protein